MTLWRAFRSSMARAAAALAIGVAMVSAPAGAGAAESDADGPLRIGTEGTYPPFSMVAEDGTLTGFDVDIARAVCTRLPRDCTIVTLPFEALIPALVRERIDVIAASMTITADRRRQLGFTQPYYRTPIQFATRRGTLAGVVPDALAGRVVAVVSGTTAHQYMSDLADTGVTVLPLPTQAAAEAALLDGRADLVLADSLALWALLHRPQGADVTFIGDPIYVGDGVGLAVRKEDEALRRDLDAALAAIRADGTYADINARYFPFDIY